MLGKWTTNLGFEVLVQLVIAAMSTEPWFIVYSCPSNTNGVGSFNLSWEMAYPLNPTGLLKHAKKSDFISLTATLSWGLLGPEIIQNVMVDVEFYCEAGEI